MKRAMTSKRPVDMVLAYESIFAEEVILLITILTETGDEVGARRIQLEASKTLDTPEIRNAIKNLP